MTRQADQEPIKKHGGTGATGGTLHKLDSTKYPEVQRATVERSDRVPGRKRSASFQRKYATAVKAIEARQIEPEVIPISTHVQCSTRTASSILARAVDSDGRFSRDSRGRVSFVAVA